MTRFSLLPSLLPSLLLACESGSSDPVGSAALGGSADDSGVSDSGDPDTGGSSDAAPAGVYSAIYGTDTEPAAGWYSWRITDDGGLSIGGEPVTIAPTADGWQVTRTFSDRYVACVYAGEMTYDLALVGDDLIGEYSGDFTFTCGANVDEWSEAGGFAAMRVQPYDTGASGLVQVGASVPRGDGEMTLSVKVRDGFAFVTRWADGLRIYDVTDPAAISEVGHLPADNGELWYDVELIESAGNTYALATGGAGGVAIIDVTDPTAPVLTNRIDEEYEIHDVTLDGSMAFLSVLDCNNGRDTRVDIVDVSDPLAPLAVGSWDATAEAGFSWVQEMAVFGDEMWVTSWDGSLAVVDISDRSAPTLRSVLDLGVPTLVSVLVTDAPGTRVAVVAGEDFGGHVSIVDAEPGSDTWGQIVGEVKLRDEVSSHSLASLGGTQIGVAWYQDGLRVIDIADPSAPAVVAFANTWDANDARSGTVFYEGAGGVTADEDFIYVADSYKDLLVFERE